MDTHPNIKPENYFQTSSRQFFTDPKTSPKPNFRARQADRKFEQVGTMVFKQGSLNNLASGYTMNSQLWDGTTWQTEKNCHTDTMRTSYRNNFNQPKPFHKADIRNSDGRMKARSLVYDFNDFKQKQ